MCLFTSAQKLTCSNTQILIHSLTPTMLARSWIAVLLLINYLLVAGLGCLSRPEDQQERVLVRTDVAGHYQECRYLRMDGLENFLTEALASQYQNAPETPKHHLISVVHGVDAHHLPTLSWPHSASAYRTSELVSGYLTVALTAVYRAVDAPPW